MWGDPRVRDRIPIDKTVSLAGLELHVGELVHASYRYWWLILTLLVGLGVGVAGWAGVIREGGSVMAMRDGFPWGLWFSNYMYYVGLSAGGLVVYSSVHLFGAEQFKPLSRIAVLQAGVLVMLALLSVLTDFERPWRFMWFLITPNFTAPFVYTGSAATLYMLLCFVDLYVLTTGKGGEKLAFTMTLIALPAAIYLHSTTAWVLALNKSRELWNAAVMVPIFLSSATASGIAFLFIFARIFERVRRIRFKKSMFRSLATLLATVIIIDLFLLVVEILTTLWPTSAKPGHAMRLMEFLTGRYAPVFLPVLILGTIAFALLARRSTRSSPAVQLVASGLYVVAIFLKRFVLMAMGFSYSPLGQQQYFYLPSVAELMLAVGIASLGALLITLAVKVLPLEVPEEDEEEANGDGHGRAKDLGGKLWREHGSEHAKVGSAL